MCRFLPSCIRDSGCLAIIGLLVSQVLFETQSNGVILGYENTVSGYLPASLSASFGIPIGPGWSLLIICNWIGVCVALYVGLWLTFIIMACGIFWNSFLSHQTWLHLFMSWLLVDRIPLYVVWHLRVPSLSGCLPCVRGLFFLNGMRLDRLVALYSPQSVYIVSTVHIRAFADEWCASRLGCLHGFYLFATSKKNSTKITPSKTIS